MAGAKRNKIKSMNSKTSSNPLALSLSQHNFHFLNSLKNLLKEPLSSLLTVLVIAIALALPACLYLLINNAEGLTSRWETTHDISVFVDGAIPESKLEELRTEITQHDDVELVRIISSKQALEEFKQELQMEMITQAIGSNPLPHTLIVSPIKKLIEDKTNKRIQILKQDLGLLSNVQEVQLDSTWVMKFRSIVNLLQRFVYLISFLLGLGVLLVVSNTIRLHVQQRQNEIEVKKLVGASDDFVRRPFLYTGFWYGFFGSVLAVVLVNVLVFSLSGPAQRLSELYMSTFSLRG